MARSPFRLVLGAALASVGFAATAVAGTAPPRNAFPGVDEAMVHFKSLVATKRLHGDLPRLSDPEAAPVLRTIWAAAGAGPDPKGYGPNKGSKDDVIIAAMVKSTLEFYELHVLDTYLLFPAPVPSPPDFNLSRPLPTDFDADHLATLFGPEVAGCLAASIVEVAEMSAVLEQGSLVDPGGEGDTVMKTIHYQREPSRRLVTLAQAFMRAPAFGADDAAPVAAALADHATDFALIFSQKDRAAIAASFAATELPDGPARRGLDRFAEELLRVPCGRLCSLP